MPASDDFRIAEKKLEMVVGRIKAYQEGDDAAMDFSFLETWKEYREKRAICEANDFKGGTIYPTVYTSSLTETTYQMIKELKDKFH